MEVKVDGTDRLDTMHAHMCENCLRNGKQVLWLHGAKPGDEEAHKCPECGTIQWKKCHIPVRELPAQTTAQAVQQYTGLMPQIIDMLLMAGAAFLLIYTVMLAVEKYREMKAKKT